MLDTMCTKIRESEVEIIKYFFLLHLTQSNDRASALKFANYCIETTLETYNLPPEQVTDFLKNKKNNFNNCSQLNNC